MAEKFAGKGRARVVFELVNNKRGVSIKHISNKPGELEVLMPSGVKYKPIDMTTTKDGLTIIRVEVESLPPAQKPAPKPAAVKAKAQAVIAKAKKSLSLSEDELDAALNAASKGVVRKQPARQVFERSGVDPVALLDDAKKDTANKLGSGAFGAAWKTPKGVVKEGYLLPTEVKALKALDASGVTPKLVGEVYFEEGFNKTRFGTVSTRRGAILMTQMPGKGIPQLTKASKLSAESARDAVDALIRSRAKIHRLGVAHNDMHPGNVLWDPKTKQMSVLDLGLARLDDRAALIEALGTRRGKIDYGKVREPGDYQSVALFRLLNPKGWSLRNSEVWKRFNANRKKVEAAIAKDGLADAFSNASIRKVPQAVSKGMTKARAKELIEMLYEGIE